MKLSLVQLRAIAVGIYVAGTVGFASTATQAAQPATITGRVLDTRGQPVQGVVVEAFRPGRTGAELELVPGSRSSIDEHGDYRVSELLPGRVLLRVRIGRPALSLPMPGITSDARPLRGSPTLGPIGLITDDEGAFVQFSDIGPRLDDGLYLPMPVYFPSANNAAVATPIVLTEGETRTHADITIPLRLAVMICGTVTGPAGPIEDAELQLHSAEWDQVSPRAWSGPGGRFEFVAVPLGPYTMTVSRASSPTMVRLSADGYPGVPQNDGARFGRPLTMSLPVPVNARAVGVIDLDVHLDTLAAQPPLDRASSRPAPPAPHVGGSATLEGVVKNDLGDVVSFARLAIFSASLGGARGTVADEHGHFRFASLPASEFTLLAAARFASAVEYGQPTAGAPGRKIAIAAREHRAIEVLTPRPGASSGSIQTPGRTPSSARVVASTDGDVVFGHSVQAEDGHYRIYGLAPGDYVVSVNGTYAPGTMSLSGARHILVKAGEEVHGVDLVIR